MIFIRCYYKISKNIVMPNHLWLKNYYFYLQLWCKSCWTLHTKWLHAEADGGPRSRRHRWLHNTYPTTKQLSTDTNEPPLYLCAWPSQSGCQCKVSSRSIEAPSRVDFINRFAPYRLLCPTFTPQNSFSKVGRRRRPQMDRALSMIHTVHSTFLKSTPNLKWLCDTYPMPKQLSCVLIQWLRHLCVCLFNSKNLNCSLSVDRPSEKLS